MSNPKNYIKSVYKHSNDRESSYIEIEISSPYFNAFCVNLLGLEVIAFLFFFIITLGHGSESTSYKSTMEKQTLLFVKKIAHTSPSLCK